MEQKPNLQEIAKKNFETWNNALQTKSPEEVAKLYRDDCVFLPTFPEEGKEVVGKSGVADYFEHFLKKFPFGVIMEEEVRGIDENSLFHAGRYNFEVGPENNRTIAKAKFTFIWKKDENGWKIFLHDSSPVK